MTPDLNLPLGWELTGELPDIDLEQASEDDLHAFTEDLLQCTDGMMLLDVGFYPEGDRNGRFVCRQIFRGDWKFPNETVEYRRLDDVVAWLRSIIHAE